MTKKNVVPAVFGLFFFYVLHDALQERAFRRPGFHFGWFMTAVEIGTMSLAAFASEKRHKLFSSASSSSYLCLLVVAITLSQGTGSVSLNYVTYPLKVAFKSCKLVPTMLFSRLVTGRAYSRLEYAAAVFMCISLAILGIADGSTSSRDDRSSSFGIALLVVAVCSDSLVPNLQEKLLRHLCVSQGEMVLVTNLGSFLLVLAFIAASGELEEAIAYCRLNRGTASMLLLQALTAYLGLRCYLTVVSSLSGVAAVLTTSGRKVLTIIFSFVLFRKPFTGLHGLSLALLAAGILLTLVAKHGANNHAKYHAIKPSLDERRHGGDSPLKTAAAATRTAGRPSSLAIL